MFAADAVRCVRRSNEGGEWTPADVFALGASGFWFNVQDPSTLWQDTSGTVPIVADGQLVARIDDISGNGNHATQSTSSYRPIYRTDGSKSWLEFNNYDSMLTGSFTVTGNEFCFASSGNLVDSASTNRTFFNHGTSFGDGNWFCRRRSSLDSAIALNVNGSDNLGGIIPAGIDFTASIVSDGSDIFYGVSGSFTQSSGSVDISRASTVRIGSITQGTSQYIGKIYELVYADAYISPSDIDGYLARIL